MPIIRPIPASTSGDRETKHPLVTRAHDLPDGRPLAERLRHRAFARHDGLSPVEHPLNLVRRHKDHRAPVRHYVVTGRYRDLLDGNRFVRRHFNDASTRGARGVGLEYEIKAKDPLPGMIESMAYMRGVLAAVSR